MLSTPMLSTPMLSTPMLLTPMLLTPMLLTPMLLTGVSDRQARLASWRPSAVGRSAGARRTFWATAIFFLPGHHFSTSSPFSTRCRGGSFVGPWCRRMRSGGRFSVATPTFLFDLDGTLVDSVYQHVIAWQEALTVCGIPLSVWRIHRRIGMSGGLFLNALQRETGLTFDEATLAKLSSLHQEIYLDRAKSVVPLPGARDLLAVLHANLVPFTWHPPATGATASQPQGSGCSTSPPPYRS